MRLCAAVEHRFDRTPDGTVWTQVTFPYESFWVSYLATFDNVLVVARVRDVPHAQAGWVRADGPGVTFAGVPHYVGPMQYLRRYRRIRRAMKAVVGPTDAVLLRVP